MQRPAGLGFLAGLGGWGLCSAIGVLQLLQGGGTQARVTCDVLLLLLEK